jgi:ATP-dependent DNA ligase
VEAIRGLPAEHALVDGEAVVFRPDGLSDFEALLTKRGAQSASFVAFDLLSLAGDDLRLRPFEARREEPRASSSSRRPTKWASRGSCRSGPTASTRAAVAEIG